MMHVAAVETVACPLCAWRHEVKPLDPRLNASTLASVFGPGIMLQNAINQRATETERALEAHLKTHTLVEWVSEVTRLRRIEATALDLLALARQYASECADCNGTGSRTITTHPGGIEVDNDDQPCEACADIRAAIAKATQVRA